MAAKTTLKVPAAPSSDAGREVKVWRDWIAANRAELSKLKPSGQSVDFSDAACNTDGTVRKKTTK